VYDACKYLQSYGHWDSSLWLAKCRLVGGSSDKGRDSPIVFWFPWQEHCTLILCLCRTIIVAYVPMHLFTQTAIILQFQILLNLFGELRFLLQDFREVASKYAENCLSRDLKKRAVLVYLSLGDVVSCLDALVAAKMIALAAQFLEAAEEIKMVCLSSHLQPEPQLMLFIVRF
jgi:hypothetical protein